MPSFAVQCGYLNARVPLRCLLVNCVEGYGDDGDDDSWMDFLFRIHMVNVGVK